MNDANTPDLPTFEDVCAAAERIRPHAVRTPLLSSAALDERIGGKVFIKVEPLQRTGSFKFRGAFNALSQFSAEQRQNGVVAFSSGNHAQGIAEAARLLGIPATIVMPSDAPAIKKAGVISRGAELIEYNRETESREEISQALCEQHNRTLIPSYDHFDIIAGQGTCGLEIFEDLERLGQTADHLVCCVGGGGLIGGINLAAHQMSPKTRVFGAEPEHFDDHKRSIDGGEVVSNERLSGSVCDAVLTPAPGRLTFAINRQHLAGICVVTDDEALAAVRFAYETLKIVVEPGGVLALASLLSGKLDHAEGKTSVIVLTGGNVDPAIFAQAIGA